MEQTPHVWSDPIFQHTQPPEQRGEHYDGVAIFSAHVMATIPRDFNVKVYHLIQQSQDARVGPSRNAKLWKSGPWMTWWKWMNNKVSMTPKSLIVWTVSLCAVSCQARMPPTILPWQYSPDVIAATWGVRCLPLLILLQRATKLLHTRVGYMEAYAEGNATPIRLVPSLARVYGATVNINTISLADAQSRLLIQMDQFILPALDLGVFAQGRGFYLELLDSMIQILTRFNVDLQEHRNVDGYADLTVLYPNDSVQMVASVIFEMLGGFQLVRWFMAHEPGFQPRDLCSKLLSDIPAKKYPQKADNRYRQQARDLVNYIFSNGTEIMTV
jgi:hypothetical protein